MIRITAREARRAIRGKLVAQAALLALVAVGAAPAYAQDEAPEQAEEEEGGFDQIIVNARRVEENIQNVPIAITAVSAERLATQDIRDLTALQRITPGVTLCCTAWNNNTLTVVRGIQQGAPTYFAEIPVASSGYGNFFDVENVQVLKGPQGTLFGQASVAGAFLYQPRKPRNELTGHVAGTLGSYDRRTVEAAVDLPLVDDQALLRVAGISSYRRGYIHDLSNDKWYGDEDYYIIRPTLTVRLGDRFESTTLYQYMHANTTGQSNGLWVLQDLNFLDDLVIPNPVTGATTGTLTVGGFSSYAALRALNGGTDAAFDALREELLLRQLALGDYAVLGVSTGCPRADDVAIPGPTFVSTLDYPRVACPGDIHEQNTLVNQTAFDITDDITIRNIFGWNEYINFNGPLDLEMSPLIFQHTGSPYNLRKFTGTATGPLPNTHSNETQILATLGIFDLQVGMFHIWRNEDQGIVFVTQTINTIAQRVDRKSETHAYYGQANVDLGGLLPGLTATVGARYNTDEIRQTIYNFTPPPGPQNLTSTTSSSIDFENVPYTVGLQWQANPDVMVFITNARSFTAGGLQNVAGLSSFAPAELNNLEIGFKSSFDLGSVPVRLNASAFRGWFKNVQVTVFGPIVLPSGQQTIGNATRNAAEALIRGFEADLDLLPFDWLELGGNVGYLKNEYTNFPSFDVSTNPPTPIDLSSTQFTRAPSWKFDVRAIVTPYDGDEGQIRLSANWSHVSRIIHALQPAQPLNPNNPQSGLLCYRERTVANGYPASLADGGRVWLDCKPGHSTVDVNLVWRDFMGFDGLTLTGAVTNVTKNVWTPSQANLDRSGGFTAFQPAVPRMWTIGTRYEF